MDKKETLKLINKIQNGQVTLQDTLEILKESLEYKPPSVEYYTPMVIIHLIEKVFVDSIDLDPASCELANKFVQAKKYYSKEDNGFIKPWSGKVYLNPPYGYVSKEEKISQMYKGNLKRNRTEIWLEKALNEYKKSSIKECICLVNRTGAQWYRDEVRNKFNAICEVSKRIPFIEPKTGLPAKQPRYYNDVLYLGFNIDRFISIFEEIGETRQIN
jgi:ParB family chromosome partitioning protein